MSNNILNKLVSYEDIVTASKTLKNIVHRTPIMTSTTVNNLFGCEVFFKCENFQRAGAFKIRGAYYAMSRLRPKKVLSYSSGNHAQAVAISGRILNIPTTIIMPSDAPKVKLDATRQYGAKVITYDKTKVIREELAAEVAKDTGATIIPPYDHQYIVAGQGTVAKELFEDVGDLDYLFVPCGGGGLLSGSAITTRSLSKNCQIIGVEPKQADDAARSFATQTLQKVYNPETIADGARTPSLGKITFPLILKHVDSFTTVSEEKIREGMFFLWERMKIIVEPTGALPIASLLEHGLKTKNSKIGIIISGGNVAINRNWM